jgi:hypothetical protein
LREKAEKAGRSHTGDWRSGAGIDVPEG